MQGDDVILVQITSQAIADPYSIVLNDTDFGTGKLSQPSNNVRIANRSAGFDCVGPPASEPLIGQLVLERMDLTVDCTRHQLTPRPESPFFPMVKMK